MKAIEVREYLEAYDALADLGDVAHEEEAQDAIRIRRLNLANAERRLRESGLTPDDVWATS